MYDIASCSVYTGLSGSGRGARPASRRPGSTAATGRCENPSATSAHVAFRSCSPSCSRSMPATADASTRNTSTNEPDPDDRSPGDPAELLEGRRLELREASGAGRGSRRGRGPPPAPMRVDRASAPPSARRAMRVRGVRRRARGPRRAQRRVDADAEHRRDQGLGVVGAQTVRELSSPPRPENRPARFRRRRRRDGGRRSDRARCRRRAACAASPTCVRRPRATNAPRRGGERRAVGAQDEEHVVLRGPSDADDLLGAHAGLVGQECEQRFVFHLLQTAR